MPPSGSRFIQLLTELNAIRCFAQLQMNAESQNSFQFQFDANDNLPGFLCNKCLLQVAKFFLFRQQAFESNMVLRQKSRANDNSNASKGGIIAQEDETIIDDDMEYVTVFVSSENQMGAETEHIQLFEPVELDDYNEIFQQRVEFEGDIAELQAADDECNSDIETEHDPIAPKADVSMPLEKQTTPRIKSIDYSADESITASTHGEDDAQLSTRKQRFRRKQNDKAKSFKCDICGKILSNHSSHKYHMQLHSAATPFLCSECGKGFKTRNAYDGHMVTHLPSNPNTCKICGSSYRQAASLRSHMLTHTGEKVIQLELNINETSYGK